MNAPLTPMESGGTWATLAQESAFLESTRETGRVRTLGLGFASDGTEIRALVVSADGSAGPADAGLLVVAAQHGSEPAGREAALRLLRDLAYSSTPGPPIVVVPTANPYGVAANTRGNASGADVNRSHVDLSTPEATALAGLLHLMPDALVIDAHEASNPDASGNPVTGQVNWRTHYAVASPAYRAWAATVPAWVSSLVDEATVSEYPAVAHEGLLTNAGASVGTPSILLETLITEAPAVRVSWHLTVMHAASGLPTTGVATGSRLWNVEEGFTAHAPTYLAESGYQRSALGYTIDSDGPALRVLNAHRIRTVTRSPHAPGLYVPMDQPSAPIVAWLLDPLAPRRIAVAQPVYEEEQAAVDYFSEPGGAFTTPEVRVAGDKVRRVNSPSGMVWGT